MISTAVRLVQYGYAMFLAYQFEQIVDKFKNLEFRVMCLWLLATYIVIILTHFEIKEFSADNMDLAIIQKISAIAQLLTAVNQARGEFGRTLWLKAIDITIFVIMLTELIQHPLLRSF